MSQHLIEGIWYVPEISLLLTDAMCFCSFSAPVRNWYKPTDEKLDFICGQPDDGGMTKCSDLPVYTYYGRRCNESAVPFSNNTPSNDSCVNWNQYYSICKPGVYNPFQGAISFDNIGLAWVAIFQVSHFT